MCAAVCVCACVRACVCECVYIRAWLHKYVHILTNAEMCKYQKADRYIRAVLNGTC
jgi:hypothetical protein